MVYAKTFIAIYWLVERNSFYKYPQEQRASNFQISNFDAHSVGLQIPLRGPTYTPDCNHSNCVAFALTHVLHRKISFRIQSPSRHKHQMREINFNYRVFSPKYYIIFYTMNNIHRNCPLRQVDKYFKS